MASNGAHRFSHGHRDLLLAVSYNIYGTRAATSSSDHKLKIWDCNEKTGTWTVTDAWTAHDAQVTDVRWNGPYVGEHIASIGEDGTLKIWQEDVNEPVNSGRRWRRVFQLVTATGVPFMGLDLKNIGAESYLAVATRDGYITVCEPEDHDDLSSWRVLWQDYLCKIPSRMDETSFRVSWHKEALPTWPAILAGLDRKSLGLAVAVGTSVRILRTDKDRKFYNAASLEGAKGLVRDVAWSNGSMRSYDTLATASKDGFVRIYELHTPGAATMSTLSNGIEEVEPLAPRSQFPNARPTRSGIGAGLANTAKGRREDQPDAPGAVKQEAKLVAELEVREGMPWRVSWNPSGDMLVSTADEGSVRIWKKSVEGKWLEAAEVDSTRE
jgi:nucleoporin SEH1